jgi:MFS family permease
MALQFLPMLLFGLHSGLVADRLPKRSILLATQTLNATATSVLAVITLTGAVRVAEVYAFASVSGLIFAFDGPARQAFAAEVVPPSRLRAAIALNAAVFQATRLIGPAIASLLIVSAGTGWVFVVNAACYLSPTIGLLRLRPSDLTPAPAAHREPGALRAAARHLRGRPDVVWTIFLVGMLGTFGLNFPVVLTSMAKSTFHGNAGTYGLFNIVLAIGSASGALLAGASAHPRRRILVLSAAVFGLFQASAAIAPDMAVFLALLGAMGFANLVFQSMANASVQLAVDPELRGRVMGLYMLAFIGGTPIGAPVIGELTSHLGARAGMAICGVVPLLAAVVMAVAGRRRGANRARSPLDRASRQPPDYVALHRQVQQDRQQGKDDPRGLKLIQLDCLVGDEGRNAETSGVQGLIGDERGREQIVVPAPEERHDPDRYQAWLGQRQKNAEQDADPAASVDQRCVDDL